MAKKKSTHQPKDASKPEPHLPNDTHIPAAAVSAAADDTSSEKLENLKSLNSLLLKETLQRRQQVEALVKAKTRVESQLNKSDDEQKALEIELGLKREEGFAFELEKSVFGVFVAAQMAEIARIKNDEVESEKEKKSRVFRERDELAVEVDRLRLQCRGLVAEKCEKEGVVEAMTREKDVADRKRLELESVVEAMTREKCVEDKKLAELESVVEAMTSEKGVADKKLAELGSVVEAMTRDKCVAERKLVELKREKSEVEKARIGQEEMVSCLEKEVRTLNEAVLSLREEKETLRKKVVELVESVDEAAVREREMKVLVKEKEDSVESLIELVKSQKEVLEKLFEDLRNKEQRIEEVTQKKNEIEVVKAGLDGEVAELSRLVNEQRDVIVTLRKSLNELEEKNAMLVSEVSQYKDDVECVKQERIEAQRSLAEQKKIVEELKLVVSEKEEKVKELDQLLGKMTSEIDNITEKNKVIESRLVSLAKENDLMQKSLSDAQAGVDDWKAKYELAERSSKKALTMLKNSSAFLASNKSEGKKELSIKEKKNLGEDIQPYAAELEAIHSAFRNNEKMVEDMKRQLESVHAVAHAQKRKSLLTTLVSSASIIAAASIAYVAKGR